MGSPKGIRIRKRLLNLDCRTVTFLTDTVNSCGMNCPFESSDVEPEVPADIVTNDSDSSAAVPSTQFSQRMRQPDASAFRPVLCQGKQANFRSPPGLSRWFTGFCTTLVAPEIGIEVEEKRGKKKGVRSLFSEEKRGQVSFFEKKKGLGPILLGTVFDVVAAKFGKIL